MLSMAYLVVLVALFVTYASWHAFRSHAPTNLGPLPVGVVWFGATGAVISGVRGTFLHNAAWQHSYDYWYYSRPLFGAVTGSIGGLIYWVTLRLGSTSAVTVDRTTFYVVAFILGFADNAFMELLSNLTDVIIKPGKKPAPGSS